MAIDNPTALTPLDFSGMANLRARARLEPGEGTVREAAQQFEALFVQMMLKSMRDALPEGGLLGSDSMSMYQEMHDQQLALDISRGGGLGLANMIAAQLQGPQHELPSTESEITRADSDGEVGSDG